MMAKELEVRTQKTGSSEIDFCEELSRLNNELANMQRELAKKNAALEKANTENERLLREDPLTKVANRRYFMERFEELSALSKRHHRPLSFLMFDLDHFKSVNDTYGHAAGDLVLKAFSDLLKSSCRAEDMPVRLGGEEFVLMLPETDAQAAFHAAERIRETFSGMVLLEEKISFTVCIGVAQLEADDNCDTVMSKADKALYVSKETGRNKVTVWQKDL